MLISLIKANLKGFARNWKSILSLIVAPLLLISIIFFAFSSNGLETINIGYSLANEQTLNKAEFEQAITSFADVTEYNSIESCISSLKKYKEYVCIKISGTGPYVLDVHYDNTRESIIWEVIERIKQGIELVQKAHSKEIASDFLSSFTRTLNELNNYKNDLTNINNDLNSYISQINSETNQLSSAQIHLDTTLDQMDDDISDAQSDVADAKTKKYQYYYDATNSLNQAEYYISLIPEHPYKDAVKMEVNDAQKQVEDLNSEIDNELNDISNKLNNYQTQSYKGRDYSKQMTSAINDLQKVRIQLSNYKIEVKNTQNKLEQIQDEFSLLTELDAETLVNPVVIYNKPAYVPQTNNNLSAEEAAKGFSMISLQTIFPTVLVLITLFLSLLISTFVTLSEINGKAHQRIRLVKGIFFPEFLATIISSFIIVTIPVFIVLLIGNMLFKLSILSNFFNIFIFIGLIIIIFTLVGMGLSYLIRKESITLMISTFILVLMIFLSGFLLPVERMSKVFSIIAKLSPGKIVLDSFNQIVFYNQPIPYYLVLALIIEASFVLIIVLILKKLRE